MRIVKVKTTHGRTLYGVLKNNFLWPTFYSLRYWRLAWSGERDIFEFCLTTDLETAEAALKIHKNPAAGPEKIQRIINRKCKC